ncbi:ABC-2 transporter permease [Kineococcus sp. SYSU DK005]|uniref:hypothetical protein n=1 Tax=Kineococcus sp. SYSU DK005 TaxID=3383126 RepID=UPI003D7ECE5C
MTAARLRQEHSAAGASPHSRTAAAAKVREQARVHAAAAPAEHAGTADPAQWRASTERRPLHPTRTPSGLSFGNLLRSELLKVTSVRSLPMTALAAVLVVVGVGVGVSAALAHDAAGGSAQSAQSFFSVPMSGVQLATVIVAALGVISITGEIASGMIRTTFLVAPRRVSVLLAKATVLAAVVITSQGLAIAATFATVNYAIVEREQRLSPGAREVLTALVANVYLLVGVALIGLALGVAMRHAAAAICTLLGALFVLPILLQMLPSSALVDALRKWWLTSTMENATDLRSSDQYLQAPIGAAAFTAWIVLLLTLAAISLRRRSA